MDELDDIYICEKCNKYIKFSEYIEFDNMCENCFNKKYSKEEEHYEY